MMITPNSLTRQKQVAQGEKEEELEDQGEEQDIIWTVVWGSIPQEGRVELGISLIFSR